MKTKTPLAMALCAAIGLTGIQLSRAQHEDTNHSAQVEAHEGTNHSGHPEAHGQMKIPDTVDGILAEIHEHDKELADTVKAKKLDDVHHHAFAIRDLAKALPAKANPDHKKMVENAVKKVSQLAEDLDKSGDAGDQAATEANLKKFDAALKTLEQHATM